MSAASARRRYALVQFLMWLPPGLMMAPMVLLMSARGLDLGEIGLVGAVYSVTIVVLELPTGGLADVVGRRTVLAVGTGFSAVGLVVMALADSVWLFFVASLFKGVARALSSGPAQAWYVDALHAAEGPDADLKPGLAVGSAASSTALLGGVLAGGLVPLVLPGDEVLRLSVPVWCGAVAAAAALVAVVVAMPEPRRSASIGGTVRSRFGEILADVPLTIRDGLHMAVRDRGLARLLLVSAAGGMMLAAIETLTPVRLAELTGRLESGSTVYAFVAAVGFAANAVGSSVAPLVARLLRTSTRAAVAAIAVAAASLGGLAASVALSGTAGVVAAGVAYFLVFAALSVEELVRGELIHLRVESARRATVMSVDSLQLQFGGLLITLGLGPLTTGLGIGGTWAAVAVLILVSSLLFVRLPARRTAPVPAPTRT
ncbi:MFS transporter [Microtetraspora malaysiensis]|uniref:MFS transporter n=1 Tax=Microtetraspora malaysiensis TaxID=161358 RepID=UPI001471975A|nr:MFS transporter [Microtetraspora malaysiensis]